MTKVQTWELNIDVKKSPTLHTSKSKQPVKAVNIK